MQDIKLETINPLLNSVSYDLFSMLIEEREYDKYSKLGTLLCDRVFWLSEDEEFVSPLSFRFEKVDELSPENEPQHRFVLSADIQKRCLVNAEDKIVHRLQWVIAQQLYRIASELL